MTAKLNLRQFTDGDANSCWHLFHDTVRRINVRDYTPVQVVAWASIEREPESWFRRFDEKIAFVVESVDKESVKAIVGFADLTRDGYLDRLFVSADHQRRGIATMLMNAIEHAAREIKLPRIHTQASITAKPFFLLRGFTVVAEQVVECRGVKMPNFLMEINFVANEDR